MGYGERSPSGHGIKFLTRAALGTETKHKVYIVEGADAIEIYDQLRYFTVTGKGKWHHRRDENQNRSPSTPKAARLHGSRKKEEVYFLRRNVRKRRLG